MRTWVLAILSSTIGRFNKIAIFSEESSILEELCYNKIIA
jgi:hypothetical protein